MPDEKPKTPPANGDGKAPAPDTGVKIDWAKIAQGQASNAPDTTIRLHGPDKIIKK